MVGVRSVSTSLRTRIMAVAPRAAEASTASAPSASSEPKPWEKRLNRGQVMISTPPRPTATADQRKMRTVSPRNRAANTTVSRGMAYPMAIASGKGRRMMP